MAKSRIVKVCGRCREDKPLTAFWAPDNKWCKACHKDYKGEMRKVDGATATQRYARSTIEARAALVIVIVFSAFAFWMGYVWPQ